MTPSALKRFAPIVHPFKPWTDDGSIWAVCVQDGKLTDDPVIDHDWTEIRLECDDINAKELIWSLVVAETEASSVEVYRGSIPDHQLFGRLLSHAYGVRDYASQLLS